MKERPILFSGPMVRAILDGRKTQTRRVLKKQIIGKLAGPNFDGLWSDTVDPVARYFACPYGAPGDRLWVRETWMENPNKDAGNGHGSPIFKASFGNHPEGQRWKPSIHMPRWASRITLEITSVRVERLQDLTEEDAEREGVSRFCPFSSCRGSGYLGNDNYCRCADMTPQEVFQSLWESINGPGSWDANPWVWVVGFKRVEGGR